MGQMVELAEELQTAGGMGVELHAQHAPAEQGGENLDGDEIVGC